MLTLLADDKIVQQETWAHKLTWSLVKGATSIGVLSDNRSEPLVIAFLDALKHPLYLVSFRGVRARVIHVHEVIPTVRLYCDVHHRRGTWDTCDTMTIRPVPED
jgi:hypothetical protein